MTPNAFHLLLAALGMVLLAFVVGARMLYSRVEEMRRKRLHP
jgi:Kef-type K+ transport system membrane component KefB